MIQVHISCLFICFLKLTLHLLIDFAESDASEYQEYEDPAQREEDSRRAYTWFFCAQVYGNLVDSSQYSTFKALLHSRKGRQEECLAVAENHHVYMLRAFGNRANSAKNNFSERLCTWKQTNGGMLAETVDADEPHPRVEGDRV